MNSSLLLMQLSSAIAMSIFSVVHKSHLRVPHLQAGALAMIFHLIEYDFLLSFSDHTSFDSSVSILYFLWLKDLVWFL